MGFNSIKKINLTGDPGQFLLNIEKSMNLLNKLKTTVAMPFYVSTDKKNLMMDCKHLRVKDVQHNEIFHCVEENVIEQYIDTNFNKPNCIGCEFYNKQT